MIDRGVVKEVDNDAAVVEVTPHDGCKSCRNQRVCCADGSTAPFRVKASNWVNAKPGDDVVLDMASSAVLFSTVVVFVLPLIVCTGAYVLGEWLLSPVWGQWVGLGVGIAVTLGLLRLANRFARDRETFKPVIVQVKHAAAAAPVHS